MRDEIHSLKERVKSMETNVASNVQLLMNSMPGSVPTKQKNPLIEIPPHLTSIADRNLWYSNMYEVEGAATMSLKKRRMQMEEEQV